MPTPRTPHPFAAHLLERSAAALADECTLTPGGMVPPSVVFLFLSLPFRLCLFVTLSLSPTSLPFSLSSLCPPFSPPPSLILCLSPSLSFPPLFLSERSALSSPVTTRDRQPVATTWKQSKSKSGQTKEIRKRQMQIGYTPNPHTRLPRKRGQEEGSGSKKGGGRGEAAKRKPTPRPLPLLAPSYFLPFPFPPFASCSTR